MRRWNFLGPRTGTRAAAHCGAQNPFTMAYAAKNEQLYPGPVSADSDGQAAAASALQGPRKERVRLLGNRQLIRKRLFFALAAGSPNSGDIHDFLYCVFGEISHGLFKRTALASLIRPARKRRNAPASGMHPRFMRRRFAPRGSPASLAPAARPSIFVGLLSLCHGAPCLAAAPSPRPPPGQSRHAPVGHSAVKIRLQLALRLSGHRATVRVHRRRSSSSSALSSWPSNCRQGRGRSFRRMSRFEAPISRRRRTEHGNWPPGWRGCARCRCVARLNSINRGTPATATAEATGDRSGS